MFVLSGGLLKIPENHFLIIFDHFLMIFDDF